MPDTNVKHNILVKDAEGNWFSIPPELESEFIYLKEEMITNNVDSDEYFTSAVNLGITFGQYLKQAEKI